MKPVDLEAAKRGEKFCNRNDATSGERRFLGVLQDGRIAYEYVSGSVSNLIARAPQELCMAPKRVHVAVNIWRDPTTGKLYVGDGRYPTWHDAEKAANKQQPWENHQCVAITYVIWDD